MISLSRRCQYALRAVLELSKRDPNSPTSVSEIASVQAIPRRFLELIIKDLKAAGLVEARRGARGGYTLAVDADSISVATVIRVMQGDYNLVDCQACGGPEDCSLTDDCVFSKVWRDAHESMNAVFDAATFGDLARSKSTEAAPNTN